MINLLLFACSFYCIAADTTINNKCSFYSKISQGTYDDKVMEICQKLRKQSDTVLVIGYRSFASCKVVFVTLKSGRQEGFIYNFEKGPELFKLSRQKAIGRLVTYFVPNIPFLASKEELPRKNISHDFSLTFRLVTNQEALEREVCYSQLLAIKDQPIGQALIFYLNNF
jgi:hypothetical protein